MVNEVLKIDLKGKRAFVAGIGDDQGFGFAIAKQLIEAGAEVIVGTWPPVLNIFLKGLQSGKFDGSRKLSNGELLEFAKIYPLDAAFDTPEDVPEEIRENKRYQSAANYTVSEVAAQIQRDFGKIDILVHSLANAPEVQKPLLETSRNGYLAALSASSYSFLSLISHFGPIMNEGGSALTLSYRASEKVIPGYGGGMSSAKAALESDVRTLAYEAGQKFKIHVNAISAGALSSRAARAIGFIERMIQYDKETAPLTKDLKSEEVGTAAAFLVSPLASGITGSLIYVDNGANIMGVAPTHPTLEDSE